MQTLRHLRNAGEEWLNVKADLGERGVNIARVVQEEYANQQTMAGSSCGTLQALARIPRCTKMGYRGRLRVQPSEWARICAGVDRGEEPF